MDKGLFGSTNTVAQILKICATVNCFVGVLIGLFLSADRSFIFLLATIVGVLVSSFLIYAFGEAMQLLSDIKYNTSGGNTGSNTLNSNVGLPKL